MDGRRTVEIDGDVLARAATVPQRTAERPREVGTPDRLSVWWALFAVCAGPAVAAFCISIEPSPANPDAAPSAFASLLGLGLLVAWAGAAVTGLGRRPKALRWAIGAGALLILATVTCPLSGHHVGVGAWWAWQFVASGGATAIAAVGWRAHRSSV